MVASLRVGFLKFETGSVFRALCLGLDVDDSVNVGPDTLGTGKEINRLGGFLGRVEWS